ncbi:hypothetical protein GXW78_17215 [Roseomonas terrae]|uniref:Uncharacterized protein n=1 Tax=Neoroseomonas terrae TaxID=424799 RepID=A0ABS5EK79_9PROT|nr:hypothetical protein [Neoroseomonas terrae]MBR0651413.1 hypothetical protein [Neoroseomonas terrae]
MPDRIRLLGIVANAALCVIFGFFAIFTLAEGLTGMAAFFALIAAVAAFNWHVIRKAAVVIAAQASQRAELERRLAAIHLAPQESRP